MIENAFDVRIYAIPFVIGVYKELNIRNSQKINKKINFQYSLCLFFNKFMVQFLIW